jgi:hypothetical protein
MSVTTGQAITLLENVLFESPAIAAANAATWVATSHIVGEDSVATLATAMAQSAEGQIAQQVVRYYMGALGRIPSGSEIQFYINVAEKGLSAAALAGGTSAVPFTTWTTIASYFEASPEFSADYGLPNGGALASGNEALVITAFYSNVLGRSPTSSDLAFYENAISQGTTVPQLLQYFTTSPEYQTSVDSGISTALASYGAAVVNGNPPATIPYVVAGQILTDTLTASALTVNGVAKTTTVTVTGTPAQAAQAAVTAVTGVIAVSPVTAATGVQGVTAVAGVTPQAAQTAQTAVTDGAVTINDANSSASGAGSITTVTLIDSGAGSVINDNALTTLALTGTTGTLAITNLNSAEIAAHSSTLALTLDGLNVPANTITDTNSEISTLTVTTANHDSTLAGFADTNLTSLSVSGTNKLTLNSINASLTSLTISGAAGFSDGASVHGTGLSARGSHLTITDTSTGSFTAVLDDTTQSFTGTAGTDVITVSALADATQTITAGSATNNEIIFEGGGYALTSASSGKFVNFQTVGVAANVTGTIDLSVIDATATTLEVLGAGTINFTNAAKGAALLLDPSSGATVSVAYSDSSGASDSANVTMSSAVAALTLKDAAATGIGTLNFINNLSATETNVSLAHTIATLTDNGLSTLNVSGSAGLSVTTLNETSTPATSFTLNNGSTDGYGVTIASLNDAALTSLAFVGTGVSSVGTINPSGASFTVTNSGSSLESIGTIADDSLTSLTLAANIALGQVGTASTTNGLQDRSTAGVTVNAGSDQAHVTVNLIAGAASGKTDSITLGNGNNIVVDASSAGTVNITLGTGANLVELGSGSLDTTAKYSVTFSARTAPPPNAILVGAAGTNYASAPNIVITGASSGDVIAFGNDSQSSSAALTATSLSSASSVATAIAALEALATSQHKVVYGVYAGNTYIVETSSGTVGITDTAVIEVAGSQTLTASTGYVTLGAAAASFSPGSLSGSGFTIPAGTVSTPSPLILGIGDNIVTMTGSTAGISDIFTSASGIGALTINYQANSSSTGTDTLQLNGSLGVKNSDITKLTVNDTSTGNAGVTLAGFTDNSLASASYNNSAATNGAVMTQQALISSSLTSISFTGGTSGVNTNNYFFTGTLTTTGTLTINDSNIGTGTATMGLTLANGPTTLTLNMTAPSNLASLAIGTLVDNNLANLNITGSGLGTVTVGTLSDTYAGTFTVTDSSMSTGASTIVLAGLSAATTLAVSDSSAGALTDASTYADSALATLSLTSSGAGALTIGGGGISAAALTEIDLTNKGSGLITLGSGGISAAALTKIVIDGSGTGGITVGPLTVGGVAAQTLLINDKSASTGNVSISPTGMAMTVTTFNVTDSGAGALSFGTLTDAALLHMSLANSGAAGLSFGNLTANAMTDLSLTDTGAGALTFGTLGASALTSLTLSDTGSATMTVGAMTLAALQTFNITLGGTASLSMGAITDTASAGLTVNYTSTSTSATTLTFASVPNATSFTVNDASAGAVTLAALTDNNSTAFTFNNTSSNLLTATVIDTPAVAATVVALTLGGSGTGAENVTVTDLGGAEFDIVDTSTATGLASVTPTLTAGASVFSVADSAISALSIGAVADDHLTSVALVNTGSATLSLSSIASAAVATLANVTFGASSGTAGAGTISLTALSIANDVAATLTLTNYDTGSVSLGTLTLGAATTNTNSLVVDNNSGAGNLSISTGASGALYATTLTLDNKGSGTLTTTLTDSANAVTTVTLSDTGAQVVNLTDTVNVVHITQGLSARTTVNLTSTGQSNDSITLGNGNNIVTVTDTTLADTVSLTLGGGTNAVSLAVNHSTGDVITFTGTLGSNANTTPVTADSFTHFLLDSNLPAIGDTLALGFTNSNIITTADVSGIWTVSHGIMTSTNATVLNFISAVQASTKLGGIAGFYDGTNSWVAYNDTHGNVAVIELVGQQALGLETASTTAGYVHIA